MYKKLAVLWSAQEVSLHKINDFYWVLFIPFSPNHYPSLSLSLSLLSLPLSILQVYMHTRYTCIPVFEVLLGKPLVDCVHYHSKPLVDCVHYHSVEHPCHRE